LTDWAYRRASHAVIAAGGLGLVALALVSRQDWLVFGGIVLPYAIVMGWRARYENQQMAARQRRTVALFQAGDAWLRPALAAVAIVLIFPSAWLALVGYALAAGGLAFWQARSAAPLFPTVRGSGAAGATSIDESDRLALWRYCVPAGLVAASGAFSLYADRWALESLLGTHELGLYFAIYQIANAPAVLFVGIVTQFFLPIIFGKAGTLDLPEQAARSARVLTLTIAAFLALMAPIVIIAWLFSEPIVRIITDQSYVAHHGLLWILMVALGLNQLGLILTYKGAYQNRLWLYVAPRLGQAALLIGSMVVLVPAIGVAGAAYAVLVAATGHVVCLIIVNRRLGRGTRREGSA
jgi:O-antigen/teichoic acid export membrane protein